MEKRNIIPTRLGGSVSAINGKPIIAEIRETMPLMNKYPPKRAKMAERKPIRRTCT